jgi:glycosyltransferase involved in cell wall biosynthesis
MNLVVLATRDPNDEDYWSGTPRSLIAALRHDGHTVTTIGPIAPESTWLARWKALYYRHVRERTYIAIRDPAIMRRRMIGANALLRNIPSVDAVIAVHPTDAAFVATSAPLILVHDAAWGQLLDYYPFYARDRLARETIAGGFELDRRALRHCDRAIYSSNWAADYVLRHCDVERGKLAVHPFGPNLAAPIAADALRERVRRRGQGACRLLFVGVDWQRKGGELAVAIASNLKERGLEVELAVVGCDPPRAAPEYVRSIGFLSRKDPRQARLLAEHFVDADFLVLPVRADCTPIVISEAAANGLPVATTAVGGIAELVDQRWGVALGPEAGAVAYANWIATSYADRARYEHMVWAARHAFETRLNWNAFAAAVVASIGEVKLARQSR